MKTRLRNIPNRNNFISWGFEDMDSETHELESEPPPQNNPKTSDKRMASTVHDSEQTQYHDRVQELIQGKAMKPLKCFEKFFTKYRALFCVFSTISQN